MRISDWSSDVCSSDLGGLVCAEAWAWHEKLLEQHADQYDPRVASRIMRGKNISTPAYIELLQTRAAWIARSEEHTSELQSLMRISYAVFCLKKKNNTNIYQQ